MQGRDDGDLRVRILGRMVRPIEDLVDGLGPGVVDPVGHGLAVMMADDLDRHLTTLLDSPVAGAHDVHVLRIEDALDGVRARLSSVVPAETG